MTEQDIAANGGAVFRDVDVLVAGGGMAGVAAAVCAARNGARTLLVERYGRLGGSATTSLVCTLFGSVRSDLVQEFDRRYRQIGRHWDLLDVVCADMLEEAGAEILLHAWAFQSIKEGNRVCGARLLGKQGILMVRAAVVIDATADADLAVHAGAAFEYGREPDGLLQPMSIMYRLGGVDKNRAFLCGSEETAHRIEWDGRSWHDRVAEACLAGRLPEKVGIIRLYEAPNPGERLVNATQCNYVSGTDVADLTRAEIDGRRQAIAITDFIRSNAPGYEQCYIAQMPAAIGVRETRRVLGVSYLRVEDLVAGRKWPDAVVRNASFPIDIHNPDGVGQSDRKPDNQRVRPYDIPYGCFVPRDLDGILLAGRCISGSHEAHASYRNQRITMAMGAAVGTAAAVACRDGTPPRRVRVGEVQRLLGIDLRETHQEGPDMDPEENPNRPVRYRRDASGRLQPVEPMNG